MRLSFPILRLALKASRANLPLKKRTYSKSSYCSLAGLWLFAMTFLLSACLPPNSTVPTEAPLASETAAPTQTIVWFPPSATPTLLTLPTYTATPDMSPGIGTATLTDHFTNKSLWDTAASDQGSASISNQRLSLAVQPGIYLTSMRHDLTVSDFYAEITAHPSLCRADDSYGILVRNMGPSFYRFILTCGGQIYAERITGGVKLQMQEPIPSGDAPRPPGEVRIGMWAVGGEMRLFLNGRYQFSLIDKSFPSGSFGVFVRASDENQMSVTFSEFKVYEVDYNPPTPTPLP